MARRELTISVNYVNNWGITEAVRELIQNYVDSSTNGNEGIIERTETELVLFNKGASLTEKSLVLGNTTKDEDVKSIGKFGEGYKLALMVLLREGKKVIIDNPLEGTTWIPSLVESRKYSSTILVVDIIKRDKVREQKVPSAFNNDEGLTVYISGLDENEFTPIIDSFIPMWEGNDYKSYSTKEGTVYTDEFMSGKIYVGGLYVSTSSELRYGYDIHPEYVTLGRDRDLIRDSELFLVTTSMIVGSDIPYHDIVSLATDMRMSDLMYLSYDSVKAIDKHRYQRIMDKIAENVLDTHRTDGKVLFLKTWMQDGGLELSRISNYTSTSIETVPSRLESVLDSEVYKTHYAESVSKLGIDTSVKYDPIKELDAWCSVHSIDNVEFNKLAVLINNLADNNMRVNLKSVDGEDS